MARLTTAPVQQYGGTTAQVAAYTGPAREIVIDTTKNTVVVQDGTTAGGHPLALEARKIIAGNDFLTINSSTEATLASDITIAFDESKLDATGLVAADDKILGVNADKNITATLSLAYNTTTGKFDIIGKDGTTVISTVTVPSSVSMVKDVELVDQDDATPTPHTGKFLHFTFTLADATEKDLYVDVTDLVDVYTGENGITVGSDNKISVNNGFGLGFAANKKLEIKLNDLISVNTGNQLKKGTDNLLFVPCDYGTMD